MNKSVLKFIAAAFTGISTLQAQIPNFSFENWTSTGGYEIPNNWGTMNNTTKTFSVFTATKATPGNPGNFYMKLTSKTVGPVVVNGIAVSGVLDSLTMQPKSGFAFNQRPANFTGRWQHMIYGTSQGSLLVTLTRWDTGLNTRVPVGTGSVTLSGMAMSWANFSIPINYTDGNNPDSCIIVLKASGSNPTNNDYLWVDNLGFSGIVAGVEEKNIISSLNVYPNPSSENLTLKLNLTEQKEINIALVDITGKTILTETKQLAQGESAVNLNIGNLSKGIYFVKLSGSGINENRKIILE